MLKGGPSSQIGTEVGNTTSHDIKLGNRTVLVSLQMIRSVTPVKVQLRSTSKETVTENNAPTESADPRGAHSIVKKTGGWLDGLGSGILVGKRYFGVLQKY